MIGRIHSVVFDAADIKATAALYAQLAGFKEDYIDEYWVTQKTPAGDRVCFQIAPDHIPPRWPDPKYPQHFHLDFRTPDMAADVERAISLGATRLEGGGESWTVLADPAGHPFCLCQSDEVGEITLQDIAIDAPDGKSLADFYAAVLGYAIAYDGPEGAYIAGESGPPVMFQNIAEYHAPRWPDPAHPQQAHLDIEVEDVEEGEAKVLELGASRLPGGGGTTSGYRVFADPVGHPFCLVWGQ
jgi:catechol 2,3-dioxygenase-like lactoylglutathione lyase family enzyme